MERIEPWPFQYTYKDVITVLAWILDAATKEEQVTNRRLSRSAVVAPVGADLRDEKEKYGQGRDHPQGKNEHTPQEIRV